MKRNILKLFAIVAAFFVGVSINNSCGESKTSTSSDASVRDLWEAIRALRTEIETLKTENNSNGDKLIDGLYFNRYGQPMGLIKKSGSIEFTYKYDSKGRVQENTASSDGHRSISTYEYSGKKVITTVTTMYNSPNLEDHTSQIITEYY